MSDINTPEPLSQADDQALGSSSAAEQSTDSMVKAQLSGPTAVLPAHRLASEKASGDTEDAGASNEVEPRRKASAAPGEEFDADKEVPPGDTSSTVPPKTTAPAPVRVKEERENQGALLHPSLDARKEVPVSAEVAKAPKVEEAQTSAGQTKAHHVEAQEDTNMQEPTSTSEDAGVHDQSSRAIITSIPQPAIAGPHHRITEQAAAAPTSKPLETDEAATKVHSASDPSSLPTAPLSAALEDVASIASVPAINGPATTSLGNVSSITPVLPAEGSTSLARRPSPGLVSMEAQERARQEEALRLQRENEDMRLRWLSLPANDHLTYYSDTEDDASASESNGMPPKGAKGRMPLLSRTKVVYENNKRKREDWLEDERESSDSEDENVERQEQSDERQYRTGNRGNKLLKGSRWNRRGKLGLWTEAKNEKEMHDRFMSRVKAIQRAGVESLLYNAPGPKAIQADGPVERDMLEGSDRLLYRDLKSANIVEEDLQSTSLAPALLRPILTARALLESHTLRHTFRNPHIGALSKTALDLRESEGHLSRALGRCFSAMERMSAYVEDAQTGEVRVNGSQNTDYEMDLQAIGAEGTAGTADEVNPALIQLDDLFVTKTGLPIPVASSEVEEQARPSTEMQAVLTTNQQRDVIRAALECLQDLGLDSLEYVERLDEVRGRLESVKRRRTQVWEALRLWALKRDGGEDEDDNAGEIEEEETVNSRPAAKTAVATNGSAPNRRRR